MLAFTGDMALLYVIPAIPADVAKDALRGSPPPDDAGDAAGKALQSVLSYAAGSLIGVRELSAAVQGFAGYSGPAGTRFWSEASRLVTQIAQGEIDEPLLRSLNSTAGVLLHYPAGALDRAVRGWNAWRSGQAGPGAILFGPPAVGG